MASPTTARRSLEALHFTVDQLDFLEIQKAGACIARSIAPDGSLKEYIQHQPKMLETIMELPAILLAWELSSSPRSLPNILRYPA
jgi:hypothetical protein